MTTWLHEERFAAIQDVVRARGARSLLDIGCGEGDLLLRVAREPGVERLVGIDRSSQALARLRARLAESLDRETARRVELLHGSMTEARPELAGFDCALLVEAIEHVDPGDLSQVEKAVFATMRPTTVVVTTPNAEFNALLGVPAHRLRHPDHRFEWGRARFRGWAGGVARRNGYDVACSDLAGRHPDLGGASQMAVFDRRDG